VPNLHRSSAHHDGRRAHEHGQELIAKHGEELGEELLPANVLFALVSLITLAY
jgi:hypothetical protein